MKNTATISTVFVFVFASVFFAFAIFAYAQETETASDTRATTSEDSTEEAGVNEPSATTSQEASTEEEQDDPALEKRTQNRITNLSNNIIDLMGATVTRLEKIAGRIESRTQKITDQGIDTGSAQELTERAQNALANAKKSLASIDVLVEEAVTSENPREKFTDVRIRFDSITSALEQARSYLRSSLVTLRGAVSETNTATTTGESE